MKTDFDPQKFSGEIVITGLCAIALFLAFTRPC